MKITLKDGSVKEYGQAMSVIDIAKDISEGLARAACAGELNGEVVDLRTVIEDDCSLNILTFDSDEGKKAFRHTASHILAQAVKRIYPETKLAIGPSIDNGFYYDMEKDTPFTQDDLEKIEKEMKPKDKLLLNMASGTPAMKSALMVLATLAEYRFYPILVSTPKNASNMEYEKRDDYDIECNWELDKDNEKIFENRYK